MPFQPAIEEPSKAWPFSNLSSLKALTGTVTCCSLPRGSVKRKSTNLTSFSLTSLITACGLAIYEVSSTDAGDSGENKKGALGISRNYANQRAANPILCHKGL